MPEDTTQTTNLRLSQAVWETVANDEIEATTVRRVAERTECTTGLLMHHFKSRTATLTHAREMLYMRTGARANKAEKLGLNPRDTLYEVLSGSLTLDTERQQEARVWMGFAAAAYRTLRFVSSIDPATATGSSASPVLSQSSSHQSQSPRRKLAR